LYQEDPPSREKVTFWGQCFGVMPMLSITLTYQPTPAFLTELANGNSLRDTVNIFSTLRLWAALNWLIAPEIINILPDPFDRGEFRRTFFEADKVNLHDKIDYSQKAVENCAHPGCACQKTLRDWLRMAGEDAEVWLNDARQRGWFTTNAVAFPLDKRLFACCAKTFDQILGKLERLGKLATMLDTNAYKRIGASKTPPPKPGRSFLDDLENADKAALNDVYKLASLEQLAVLDERLEPVLAILKETLGIQTTPRTFLHIDYIVPKGEKRDHVGDIQYCLEQVWKSDPTPVIAFTYNSVDVGATMKCVVYPVCIYYVQRAKYLCAYGRRPTGDSGWHNYRLDRIIYEPKPLTWDDARIPKDLVQKYEQGKLPEPDYIHEQMKAAWGFDFYLPAKPMLLRFERDFHDRYIKDTLRHETFIDTGYDEAQSLIEQDAERKALLQVLSQRSSQDAYYTVQYRETDNNLIMRLRAWGSKVEVLFPASLRQRLSDDARALSELYT
jgi:CRISPR-associated protein (TIGR03985 family)